MIHLKTEKEIGIMRVGGKILAEVLSKVIKSVRIGISELELDQLAERLILEKGGEPGFKKVEGYQHTICISTNDVVVHGIPTDYKLKEGDKVGIDCGVYYKGFHTDMAQTTRVQSSLPANASHQAMQAGKFKVQSSDEVDRFLEAGEKAMWEGIKAAKLGQRVGDISKAIQKIVEGQGYSVVRNLIGHGVGKELHEDPEVPGFLTGSILRTPLLKEGMTIAVEVIYNMGKSGVVYSNDDGWTIKTKDGSLSGLFERSIAITREGPVVLTK
jgi:methionyl aminopeptidase